MNDADAAHVFIGGYMHSGTTLLGEVIGNLPGVHRPDHETKFLEFMHRYRALHPLGEPGGEEAFRSLCRRLLTEGFSADLLAAGRSPDRVGPVTSQAATGPAGRVDGEIAGRDHLDVFLDEVDELIRSTGDSVFVEHTGTNVFAHQELARCGRNVYLVDIVRDPRDVLASKKTRRATVFTDRYRPDQQRRKHFEKSFDPVWDTLSWRSFVRAGDVAASAMPTRYLRVRYEDLVTDPDRELARVAALLGVEPPSGTVQVSTNNAADVTNARAGVDASSVGRWRTVLDAPEAAACSCIARREMATLGYATESVRPGPALARPLAHAAIEPVVRVYRRFRLLGAAGTTAIVRNYAMRARRSRSAQ